MGSFKLLAALGKRKKICSNFSFSTKNKSEYDLALEKFKKGDSKRESRRKFYKYFYYSLTGGFAFFYVFYIAKSSGIFLKLKFNEKYKEHVKIVQEKHNVDQELIDRKISEFDEKYEINKRLEIKEERIKYGNKVLNERITAAFEENRAELEDNTNPMKEMKTIDLTLKDKENQTLIEEYNTQGERILYTRNQEYEQIKILQGAEEENPDPRIMGNTIIFDSRLNQINNSNKNSI